jgi:alkylation response protein AidB-like acyl-CoA dehydrogenase
MTTSSLIDELRFLIASPMPVPGQGATAARHLRLMAVGCQDLELARLAEAHWDAIAILAEANRQPESEAIYGVWASEIHGEKLALKPNGSSLLLSGTKRFCSGTGIVTNALVTVTEPQHFLVDVQLPRDGNSVCFDESDWKTNAFAAIHTTKATFNDLPIRQDQIVGPGNWYLERVGFWWGACGPAACWAGGGQALANYALVQQRQDAHSLAHLGAMQAAVWQLRSCLIEAGRQIDTDATTPVSARIIALTLRHLVEQACTDILRRFARAYGPRPLISDERISRLYQELDLYLRQSHAERDLEQLGRALQTEK